jgi:RNA polymerase sigma-70 factor (ECF subfamily)
VRIDEFDEFYARSASRIVGQVYALIGDLVEAQDVVQDAFVLAWRRRDELSSDSHPEAWVRIVAYRLAVNRWHRARRGITAWLRHGPAANVAAPDIEHTAIVAALRRIPEEQRRAIVLHHLCDLSVNQVAEETGVSAGTVKARLSRGRAALKEHLKEQRMKTDNDPLTADDLAEATRG